jgi:hypothetical protein
MVLNEHGSFIAQQACMLEPRRARLSTGYCKSFKFYFTLFQLAEFIVSFTFDANPFSFIFDVK